MAWSVFVTRLSFSIVLVCFFFFNYTATTEIYTLSLHDALPISMRSSTSGVASCRKCATPASSGSSWTSATMIPRSEEHTSELQSQSNLVCRLLLEKKKKNNRSQIADTDSHNHANDEYDTSHALR